MTEQTISVQTSKFCTLQVSVSVTIHVFGVPVNNQNSVVCYSLSVVRGLSIGPADDTQAPWDILDDSVSNRIILSIGIFGVVLLIIIETTGEYCLPTQFPSYPHFIFFYYCTGSLCCEDIVQFRSFSKYRASSCDIRVLIELSKS